MKATFVKDIKLPPGNSVSTVAGQKLWKLDAPYDYGSNDWDDEAQPKFCKYIVSSAATVMFSGPETYIFPADEEGTIIDWGELPGSYKGGLDHDMAILGFETEI